jgi:hypothetical protein
MSRAAAISSPSATTAAPIAHLARKGKASPAAQRAALRAAEIQRDVAAVTAVLEEAGILKALLAKSSARSFARQMVSSDGFPETALIVKETGVALVIDPSLAGGNTDYRIARKTGPDTYETTNTYLTTRPDGIYVCSSEPIAFFKLPKIAPSALTQIRPASILSNGSTLMWHERDVHGVSSGSGAFVKGFPADLDDKPVFVKAISDVKAFTVLSRAVDIIDRRCEQNPNLAAYFPKTHFMGSVSGLPASLASDGKHIVGVAADDRITGMTLDTWACGHSSTGYSPGAHQIAAAGLLVARGLAELNRDAPPQDRVLAPDFCKPDNIMVVMSEADKDPARMPRRVMFVDKDSILRQGEPDYDRIAGHPYWTPTREIDRCADVDRHGKLVKDYSSADKIHAFQFGRLLYSMTGLEWPQTLVEKQNGGRINADMYKECGTQAYSDACNAQVRRAYGPSSIGSWGELGDLIADCTQADQDARPAFDEIEKRLSRIITKAGHKPPKHPAATAR